MKANIAKFQVVTITLNPAIDRTVTVSNFTAGTVNRVESVRSHPGGKGVNVASALADHGHETGSESRAYLWLRGLDAGAASRGPAQTRGCARGGEVEAGECRCRGRPLLSGPVQNRKVAISRIREGSNHGCNTNKGVNQS